MSHSLLTENGDRLLLENDSDLLVTEHDGARRFYFPSGGSADLSPTISVDWEHSSGTRLPFSSILGSTALTTVLYAPDVADHLTDDDALVAQFVCTDVLATQTLASQTVTWVFQGQEDDAGNNLFLTFKLFLCNSVGVVKTTLVDMQRDDVEMVSTATASASRSDSAIIPQTVVAAGDRFVVEIGFGGTPTATANTQGHNGNLRFGENAIGGDLSGASGQTGTTLRPWLEFTDLVFFQSASESTAHEAYTYRNRGHR